MLETWFVTNREEFELQWSYDHIWQLTKQGFVNWGVRREDIGSTPLRKYPDNLKTITKALVQLVLKTLVQVIRVS